MKTLYLYLISQSVNKEYDTFDSAVVVAHSPEEARLVHPKHGLCTWQTGEWTGDGECLVEEVYKDKYGKFWDTRSWCKPDEVEVLYIGIASPKYNKPEVICSSFNAG